MHTLIDHMIDVSAVFASLVDLPAMRRALAFLHDVGKANAAGTSKRWLPRASGDRPLEASADAGRGGNVDSAVFARVLSRA